MALIETYRPGSEGEDTYVDSAAPALTNGGSNRLVVGRSGSAEQRAFVKFAVPRKPGWDVVNAIMRITVDDFIPNANPAVTGVTAHRIGSSWDENATTWNDQPGVSGAALSTVVVSGSGVVTFGVADALDAWQAGQNNNGIRLAYAPGGDANIFTLYSSDSTSTDARPYLQVTWSAKAPNAPIVQAEGFPANESTVLSWIFSHDDPNAQQTAYAVEIRQVSDDSLVLIASKTTSSSQQIGVPAGTLENGVQYQWRVQTWGPDDVMGPWSAYDLFTTAARPVAVITAPTSGQVVDTSAFLVGWSYTEVRAQAQYRLRMYLQSTGQLAFDSGVINSTLTSHPLSALVDNAHYRLELEVVSDAGIGNSPIATLSFSVDTVPPPAPGVTVLGDSEAGVVRLTITNPAPGVGQVATAHNEIWRRVGTGDWTRVAASVASGSTFTDPSASGGVDYEYRVDAISVVATTASTSVSVRLYLNGVWLYEPSNPLGTLVHLNYDGGLGRTEQWTPEVELLRFAGRAGAVAEFGSQVNADFIDVSVQLPAGNTDRTVLRALAHRRSLVCYRDGQNRKVFGVISNLSIRDQAFGGTGDFRLDVVDYTETGV